MCTELHPCPPRKSEPPAHTGRSRATVQCGSNGWALAYKVPLRVEWLPPAPPAVVRPFNEDTYGHMGAIDTLSSHFQGPE